MSIKANMLSKRTILGLLILASLLVAACRRDGQDDSADQINGPGAPEITQFADADTALAEGNRLLDNGETELAIAALEQAVKLNPDLAEGYFKLGIAWSLIEIRDKTAETSGPVESTPTPAKDGKTKVLRTNSEKYFQKAVDAYKKIIAANDADATAWFNLGRAYNKLNEDEEAEKALRQAVKLNPDDTEFQTELGAILIKLAKYSEAVAALKKALDLDPENSKAQDLLDDAEAGQRRVAYVTKPKDEKKPDVSPSPSPEVGATPAPGDDTPPPPERPRTVNPKPTPAPTRH